MPRSMPKLASIGWFWNRMHLQMCVALAVCAMTLTGHALAQTTPQPVYGEQIPSALAPAVTTDGTNYYIAWVWPVNYDIYFAKFDGNRWSDYQVVGANGWIAATDAAPAIAWDAYTGSQVWLAWKGYGSASIYYSTLNLSSGAWSNQQTVRGSGWKAETTAAGPGKSAGPTLYGGNNDPNTPACVAWQGLSTDIWYSCWNYPGWEKQQTVSLNEQTPYAPSIYQGARAVSYLGPNLVWTGSNGDIYWMPGGDGFGFSFFPPNGPVYCNSPDWTARTSASPAATISRYGDSEVETFFWKGYSDNQIWYTYPTYGECFGQQSKVEGSGWSAASYFAPAAAGYCNSQMIVWTDDNTGNLYYLNPLTLPGLSQYANCE